MTSATGGVGEASEMPEDAKDGESRLREGGGDDRRRRSTPLNAEGRAEELSRAEAREAEGSVDGLKSGLSRRLLMEGWEIWGENGPWEVHVSRKSYDPAARHGYRVWRQLTVSSPDSNNPWSKLPPTQAIFSPCAVVNNADFPAKEIAYVVSDRRVPDKGRLKTHPGIQDCQSLLPPMQISSPE